MNENAKQQNTRPAVDSITIVYDGECPFCQQYTRLVRLRESAGKVHLVDARSDDPVVRDVVNRGYDLDESMVVIIAQRFYQKGEAMQVLAMLSTRQGWFNRLNFFVFSSERVATVLYPLLRAGRNLVLRLLRRSRINS